MSLPPEEAEWVDSDRTVLHLSRNKRAKKVDRAVVYYYGDMELAPAWKTFWEDRTEEQWPDICIFRNCPRGTTPYGGAFKISHYNSKDFVIPTCEECQTASPEFRNVLNGTQAAVITEEDDSELREWRSLGPFETNVEAKNVEGSAQCDRSGTWKSFWEERTQTDWPDVCSFEDCEEMAEDGAHVEISTNPTSSDLEQRIFIIPTCPPCNRGRRTDFRELRYGTVAALLTPEDTEGPSGTCS